MALLELANELLLSIAEALGSETDINAFVQLNRRCFQLLNPYLYRFNVQQNRSLALFWAAKRGELNTVVRLDYSTKELISIPQLVKGNLEW